LKRKKKWLHKSCILVKKEQKKYFFKLLFLKFKNKNITARHLEFSRYFEFLRLAIFLSFSAQSF
jgi:hypothetical protein